MTSPQACPSCGETESLRGTGTGDDIEITCGHCGHHWIRGGPACRTCGGHDVATIPQVMARTSRGNQLSIVGNRDVTLCADCDAEMIASCKTSRTWVPEDYASAYLTDRNAVRPEPEPAPEAAPIPDTAPLPDLPTTPQPARTEPPEPAAKIETVRPTVRQAISEHMAASSGADPLAMLSLGQHLGPSARLEDISGPQAGEALKAWFATTWSEHDGSRRAAVRRSIIDAYAFWLEQGWITSNPSVDLPV